MGWFRFRFFLLDQFNIVRYKFLVLLDFVKVSYFKTFLDWFLKIVEYIIYYLKDIIIWYFKYTNLFSMVITILLVILFYNFGVIAS